MARHNEREDDADPSPLESFACLLVVGITAALFGLVGEGLSLIASLRR